MAHGIPDAPGAVPAPEPCAGDEPSPRPPSMSALLAAGAAANAVCTPPDETGTDETGTDEADAAEPVEGIAEAEAGPSDAAHAA